MYSAREKLKNSFTKKYVRCETGCWKWIAAKDENGYGVMWDGVFKKRNRATRVAIFLFKNVQLTPKMLACHSCDNPECVNPDHLFVGSHKDNSRDMCLKGRYKNGRKLFGSKHFAAKLTEESVLNIRREYARGGVTYAYLGNKYEIDKTVIGRIIRGTAWKHVATKGSQYE